MLSKKEMGIEVTPIKEHPEFMEAQKKLSDLRGKLASVNERLFGLGNEKASAAEDGQDILNGKPLGVMAVSREDLNREKAAVSQAIAIQIQKVQEVESSLIRATVKELTKKAEVFEKKVLAAYESCLTALQNQEDFYRHIQSLGLHLGQRPAFWTTTNYDRNFMLTIEFYLNQRGGFWGFPVEGKRKF